MGRWTSFGGWLCLLWGALAAAQSCDANTKCPQEAPCCSLYGQCGVGAYCLGGCDPLFSYSINSCVASPVCQSGNFDMNSLNDIQSDSQYLGDTKGVNWVSQGEPLVYADSSILLTMAEGTVGTLLTSTHYVWYGKVSVTMQSSAGAGVVTAFILQSDVRDELDFEFVGVDLQHVQSNFYWQGMLNYTNSANLTAPNTNTETHTYTFDWTPDSVSWLVDGQNLRTLYAADTYNASSGEYQYPQTPARVMLSLWPAGSPGNGQGTIDWAGGLITWDSPYMANGYYYAQILNVEVECYGPYAGANVTGSKSYIYNDESGLNDSVAITNDNTILASFYATGENEGFNPDGSSTSSTSSSATSNPTKSSSTATSASSSGSSSSSTTSGAAMATESVNTVPGAAGGGVRGDSGSGSSTTSASGSSASNGGFSQGLDTTNAAAGVQGERALKGSVFAVLVAIVFGTAM